MAEHWIDGLYAEEINQAMTEAREAFNQAYFHSSSSALLATNAAKAIKALASVERMALTQVREARK